MSRSHRRAKAQPAAVNADLAWKVLDYFKTNKNEVLSSKDIAAKFGVAASQVDTLLKPAVDAGHLRLQNHGQFGLCYRAAAGAPKFPATRTDALQASIAVAKRVRRAATRIDLSAVKIEHGVPLPSPRSRADDWAALFSRMKPGDSFPVPRVAHDALSHAKVVFCRASPWKFTIRKLNDDTSRIWRTK